MPPSRDDSHEGVTRLFASWMAGDKAAGDRLFVLLYAELRPLAHRLLRGQAPGGSLDTIGVVHDAYIKLTAGARVPVRSRAHFLALASRAMRQIIVDHARRRAAHKRGGERVRVTSFEVVSPDGANAEDLVTLDAALDELEARDARLARLVELRFFGGLGLDEVAEALGVSVATVKRDWLRARAFLYQQVHAGDG